MATETAISWTQHTWNPWRGCTKISPGCKNCYMYTAQLKRARFTGNPEMWNPFKVLKTTTWGEPIRWQREAAAAGRIDRVFTCSWSDFFHEDADVWRPKAWQLIHGCPNLHFQILTKRPENILKRLPPDWNDGYENVWLGVSIESPDYVWRAMTLRDIRARIRFISAEPLLAPLSNLDLRGFHWLIVGGESGPGYRPMGVEWARELREKARAAGVAFFFKQSAAPRTEMGTKLDGREYKEYPL
jgi:protein gp37